MEKKSWYKPSFSWVLSNWTDQLHKIEHTWHKKWWKRFYLTSSLSSWQAFLNHLKNLARQSDNERQEHAHAKKQHSKNKYSNIIVNEMLSHTIFLPEHSLLFLVNEKSSRKQIYKMWRVDGTDWKWASAENTALNIQFPPSIFTVNTSIIFLITVSLIIIK